MKLLYLGNKTSKYNVSKSVLETLEPLFAEFARIHTASFLQNKLLRLLHFVAMFVWYAPKADFVLVDVYSTQAYRYAELIGFLTKLYHKRLILILHGGDLPKRHQTNPQSIEKLFKKASYVVAPSPYLKNYFEQQGYAVQLIPNSIELTQYPFFLRENVRPRALALRGFKPTYNVKMTIEAIKLCRDKGVEIELLLLGNEDEADYNVAVQAIQELNLASLVQISPKLPKATWIERSKDYDFMISNPFIDNTPVSVIEGMALGMCVITTEVGGVPDIVENEKEVLFIPSNDSEALSEALLRLVENTDLSKTLSLIARKKAEQFDWEVVKKKWEEILTN